MERLPQENEGIIMSKKIIKKKKINPMRKVRENASLMDKLTDEIVEQGVTLFTPQDLGGNLQIDTDYLSLPSDLTEVPSRELGKYLNAFTQNKAYMRTLYNWQEMLTEEKKRIYYDVYVEVYSNHTKLTPKASEKSKELLCNNDEHVKDKFLEYRNQKLKLSMLANTIASYEEMIFLISREITRRNGDFSESNRIDNLK